MKKLISLVFLMCWVSFGMIAQTFTVSKSSKKGGFDVESGVATGKSITVEGLTFKIFKTKTGSKYLKCPSSKGGVYARWVGEPTSHVFEGKKVRVFKSGKHFYLRKSKNGKSLSPKYLDKNSKNNK